MAPACSGSPPCPQFAIDPEKLRAGIKALPRDAGTTAMAFVLSQIEGGPAVLETRAADPRGHCQAQRQRPRRRGYPGAQFLL